MSERLPPQPWITDPATVAVIDALEKVGGPGCARFVGGCVRDALLDRAISDIDIATPLVPERVAQALRDAGLVAVPTGIEHGTVTAIADHRPFEITTLRRDVETDGRRAVVTFTTDWAEDAARRDFRLNALYLDREGRLFDPVGGGVEDAHAGRIIFVGDPEMRIREDYLRILRFFRFTAWFGKGAPDTAALSACAALKAGVEGLSGERLSKELLKLLAAPDPSTSVRLMIEAGILGVILPFDLLRGRFEAVVQLTGDAELRLAALLPDDADAVRVAASRLRLSNALRDRLVGATSVEDASLGMDDAAARAAIYRDGARVFEDRLTKRWAEHPEAGEAARRLLALARDWTPPRFPLGGADAMAAGIPKGPEVGRRLGEIEVEWVAGDFAEDRAALLARLKA